MPTAKDKHQQEPLSAADRPSVQERFLSLIDDHQRLIHKICWTYTYTSHDRDDLFQEIVGRLWSSFASYDPERRFSTWMYRVALNVAIDFRRRRKRFETVNSLEETREQTSPTDTLKRDLSLELRELLERQNDADRAILLLYLEGNSYREIAEVIGISESNVGTRLGRLKQSLRRSANS